MNQPPMHKDELTFTINEVATQIGVVPATIRNWEKQGLFVARRSDNGYRMYSMADIERLRLIKQYSKDKNMGVKAIRMLYGAHADSDLPPAPHDRARVSKSHLGQRWRELRQERGFLLEDVARQVGISTSYLSKIENVQANVSLNVLQKLAALYGVEDLYRIREPERQSHLVKKNHGEVFSIGIDGMSVESVVSGKSTLSPMIYTVEPGSGRRTPSAHTGEEFVHVLSGRILIQLDDEEYALSKGDSISFHSTQTHSWHNHGKTTARILWVYTPTHPE